MLENAPVGMQISGNGLIQWSIDNQAETADYSVTVIVEDAAKATGTRNLELSVKSNELPTMAVLEPVTVKIEEALEIQVTADDPDGDNAKLKYLLRDAPEGMQISGSGLIQWSVPKDAEDATFTVTVFAVDDRDGLTSGTLEVTVSANKPPTVEPVEAIVVNVGDDVGFTISATDPEGGKLTYKALNNPSGFKRKIRNGYNGVFLWYTAKASAGDYTIDIEVKDAGGLKTVVTAQITLETPNMPPTVEPIEPIVAEVGDDVGFTVSATDPEGGKLTYKALNNPSGFKKKIRNGYNGVFLWYTARASAGDYTIDIEVKDAGGLKTVVTAQITLEPVTALTLISAPSVLGPFEPEVGAVIDEDAKTITVATAGVMRFYRLLSGDDTKLRITTIAVKDDKAVMGYEPAGE
jgi:hypothetical protein